MAAFLGYCTFAQDLGIKLIRVDAVEPPSIFEKEKIDPKVGFDRAVKAWDVACKMAADHGLEVSWEFEPGFAFNKPSEIVSMIDAVRAMGNSNFKHRAACREHLHNQINYNAHSSCCKGNNFWNNNSSG